MHASLAGCKGMRLISPLEPTPKGDNDLWFRGPKREASPHALVREYVHAAGYGASLASFDFLSETACVSLRGTMRAVLGHDLHRNEGRVSD